MFKRQAHVHTKLAVAIVSALFLSISAHAGLLGAGGVATGVTGSAITNMTGRLGVGTPMPVMNTNTLNAASMGAANFNAAAMPAAAANAAAAAHASSQTRVQGAFSAPTAAAMVQPVGPVSGQVAGQVVGSATGRADANGASVGQAGATVAGRVTDREAAAVSTGEDIMQQAERLTRKGRTTGAIVVEQATDAQGQVSGQAIRIKQSGEASANAQVTAARGEASTLGARASGTAAATASAFTTASTNAAADAQQKLGRSAAAAQTTTAQGAAKGSVSGSGSLQASSRKASLASDASARGTATVTN